MIILYAVRMRLVFISSVIATTVPRMTSTVKASTAVRVFVCVAFIQTFLSSCCRPKLFVLIRHCLRAQDLLSLILGLLRIIIDEVILCKLDFKSLLAEDLPSPILSRIASRLSRPAKERSQRFNRKSSLGGPI